MTETDGALRWPVSSNPANLPRAMLPTRRLSFGFCVFATAVTGCSSRGATSAPTPGPNPVVLTCGRALSIVCDGDASDSYLVSEGCPPQLPSSLPGSDWCSTNPGAGAFTTGSCAGYVVLPDFFGSDQYTLFLYPADGGALAAIVPAGNLSVTACLAGSPDFALPFSCFGDQGDQLLSAFKGPGEVPACLPLRRWGR